MSSSVYYQVPVETPLPAGSAPASTTAAPVSFSTDALPIHPKIKKPLLRLEIRDLSCPGAQSFLALPTASTILSKSVDTVLSLLYKTTSATASRPSIPPVRSITLVLRPMAGVAYTTGLELDDEHKEIHLSTSYLSSIASSRFSHEASGVLVHETVHCFQNTGCGTAPGGLIEGVADWVRLKASLAPPHWKRETTGDWDAGYATTGFFLDWLEQRFGEGAVRKLNARLGSEKYTDGDGCSASFWDGLFGQSVESLWEAYGKEYGKSKDSEQ